MSAGLAEIIDKAVATAAADEVEILAYKTNMGLTRVANSRIHQNVTESNSAISVRAIKDRRIGFANTNRTDADSVKGAVKRAISNAGVSHRAEDWPGLPEYPATMAKTVAEATKRCTPGRRAEIIQRALTKAKNDKLTAAGALETGDTELLIANNRSPVSTAKLTTAGLNMVLMSADSSGYTAWVGGDIDDLDIAKLSDRAAEKAEMGRSPGKLKPGRYTVILEPNAVADMLSFLAYVGLGALSFQENRSFMCGKLGEMLVDPKITLWDDGRDARTLGPPFDYEGVPKQKVVFFNQGRAEDVVYDTRTAARAGTISTGHALPAPNPIGPVPTNLFLATGETSVEQMIKETKTGIYVTRFHYTNIEEPIKAVLTGMTRDGTFLIKDGELAGGLKNMRFTQSILDALNSILAVGNTPVLVDSFLGACLAPALKIENFNMTGVSEK